jgi:tetratricopeptide (TPR) repeat protein
MSEKPVGLPSPAELSALHNVDIQSQLKTTQEKLDLINERLNKIALTAPEAGLEKGEDLKDQGDWTKSYQSWEKWNEKEQLVETKQAEEAKFESLAAKSDNLGHVHDHSEERDFFHLPEAAKLQTCLEYRSVGNYLVWEGNFPEAITAYETALSYYEYCFPEEETLQKELDALRIACFCNVALCYIRVEEYRKAIESATNAINDSKETNAKAFFRRAQAYRLLDEYE